MRNIVVSLVFVLVSVGSISAQTDSSFIKDLTLCGEVRMGSNYASLFGAIGSDNLGIFTKVDVSHKSGFGLGFYRQDDFSSESMTGRVGFVDLYWYGNLTKNLSLYAAAEYGWWDNWSDGRFWSPYAMLFYDAKVVNFTLVPIYIYYDKLESDNHELIVKLQASKKFFNCLDVQLSGWYDNLCGDPFYGSVGAKLDLPKNFYFQGDILWKNKETHFLWGVGMTFGFSMEYYGEAWGFIRLFPFVGCTKGSFVCFVSRKFSWD